MRREKLFKRGVVGDVEAVESEVWVFQKPFQAPFLEADVVGVVEVVNPYDVLTLLEQELTYLPADEAGTAGDQDG